jgi:Bbp16-like protein
MALIDNQLMYSDAQALTATANSTNVIDFGTGRNLGSGTNLYVLFQFGAVTSNATWQANVQGADDAAITSNVVTVAASKTITPVANTYYVLPVPPSALKRFSRITYTLTGGTTPSITTTSTFVLDPEKHLFLAGSASLY